MVSEQRKAVGGLFESLAESLDISNSQYEEAKQRYEAVGEWLNTDGSPLADYAPQIYPQGSFRLGTVVKPINDADEYDVDLVCELKNLEKDRVTQKQLKQMVGDRLKANERYQKMLKEDDRCWELLYAESARFHMDILPAIPDHELNGIVRLIGPKLVSGAILITDKKLHEWQKSNPAGYAEWFKERMRVILDEGRRIIAKAERAEVEQIPEYKVRTPLQRAVQVLKRHRDIVFEDDRGNRPLSIIISTLAAQSYNNEPDLIDALENIVGDMPNYIESRSGIAWVPNPVNPLENFAETWQAHPQRERKFKQWIQMVQIDIETALGYGDLRQVTESLKPHFGDRAINAAATKSFPSLFGPSAAAVVAPRIHIANPSKPWGV